MRQSVKHLPALRAQGQLWRHDFTLHLNPAATKVQSEQQRGWSVMTQLASYGRVSETQCPHPETSHIDVLLNPPLPRGAKAPCGPGPLHYRGFTVTLGGTPLEDWSARRRDIYLVTHNTHQWRTGGVGVFKPPPPRNSKGPPKLCQTQPGFRKLLKKNTEFRTPTPQDVRKKGSKILKLPRFAIVLY